MMIFRFEKGRGPMEKLELDFEPSLGPHKNLNDNDIRLLAECSQAISLKRIADAMELLTGKGNKAGQIDSLLDVLQTITNRG